VLPGRHHRQAPEATHVAELEHRTVVEAPPRPHVGVEHGRVRPHAQLAGHAQVHDQLPIVVEADQQVLAPPIHPGDHRTGGLRGLGELRRRVTPPGGDHPADHQRLELAPDGLDLRQLGQLLRPP
jgi:hypothetical protein